MQKTELPLDIKMHIFYIYHIATHVIVLIWHQDTKKYGPWSAQWLKKRIAFFLKIPVLLHFEKLKVCLVGISATEF